MSTHPDLMYAVARDEHRRRLEAAEHRRTVRRAGASRTRNPRRTEPVLLPFLIMQAGETA